MTVAVPTRSPRIGFMQGRLTPLVDGRIQAFPRDRWRVEFGLAADAGFSLMEWTLDQDGLAENPLITAEGQAEIKVLSERHGVAIRSLTGDNFMHAPYWKACSDEERTALIDTARSIVRSAAAVGVCYVVIPLVDGGSLETPEQEASLLRGLADLEPSLTETGMVIVFESDFSPDRLARFIAGLPRDRFGINYDTGNSAALGYDTTEEIGRYGDRILNVHVKDRRRGGGTVPLGDGAADLPRTFCALAEAGYRGDYILQTARAEDGDHVGVAVRYRALVRELLAEAGLEAI